MPLKSTKAKKNIFLNFAKEKFFYTKIFLYTNDRSWNFYTYHQFCQTTNQPNHLQMIVFFSVLYMIFNHSLEISITANIIELIFGCLNFQKTEIFYSKEVPDVIFIIGDNIPKIAPSQSDYFKLWGYWCTMSNTIKTF